MSKDAKTLSALAAAAIRATESFRPEQDRLIDDCFTLRCLPPLWRAIARLMCFPAIGSALLALRERLTPGIIGNLLCRTRYIDDTLSQALEGPLDQVVILGAGFDTRPYRVPGIRRTHVFEIDHPAAQACKRKHVTRVLGHLPDHVTFVPLDFNRERLAQALPLAGFAVDQRTFFIWEGVTQYIRGEAVDATLRDVVRITSRDSRIVFTYIWEGIIDGSARSRADERILASARRLGSPWVFGLEPVKMMAYLDDRGLTLLEDVGAEDHRRRYLEPSDRRMNLYAGERIVLAQAQAWPLAA